MAARFSRRGLLRGAFGAAVALPLWYRLGGRREAHAGGAPRPGFAVFVRAGNGVAAALPYRDEPEQFWPGTAPGALTQEVLGTMNASRAVSELQTFASRLLIIKGLDRPFGTPACGHAESIPQCLTAARVSQGVANEPQALGRSADWAIASALNAPGREPLTLMAGPRTAYIAEALSWRDARVRENAQRSPLAAYMGIVGLSGAPPEVLRRLASRRQSVNDLVRAEMQDLLGDPNLGALDRQRLRQHFEAIRDTELNVVCGADPELETELRAIMDPEANDVRPEVVRKHMAVIALAFSCGLTHAATLQVGEGNDQTQYTIDGNRLPRFHWISHRIEGDGETGAPIANAHLLHHDVDRLQLRMFLYLLERLDAYPSVYGTGTLLDDSAAVWLNDLGSGPPHSGENIPWIIAGGAGGTLRTGRYVDLPRTPLNKALNTVIAAVGARRADGSVIDDFGDTSLPRGVIEDLTTVR